MRTVFTADQRIRVNKINDFVMFPVVIRVNQFNEEALEEFEEDMDDAHSTGQPVIPILIDSFGGSVYGCQAMITSILNSKVPVATIVTSKAMSAGAVLFGFGTEGYRFMDKHASLMIHDAAQSTAGKVEEIKADADHLDALNQSIYKRLARHLGHKDENHFLLGIKEHRHADWYLNANEAKQHKLANHIRVPEMKVHVGLDISFK